VLLTLDLEGGEQLAIPKSIQRHPIKGHFEHVDLLAVRLGEKVTIDVPVVIVGDVVPGGMVSQESTTIRVEAEATHLPTGFEINIDGLAFGTQVTASDVSLPTGSALITDPDSLILVISEAPTAEQLEAEDAAAAEELGIVQDAPQGSDAGGESSDGGDSGENASAE
jgi:large subunit ribosomal protein L25